MVSHLKMEKNELTSRDERKTSSQGRRRVCLMGLSADPPTNAHVAMAKILSSSLKSEGWDELRIIPVFQHPFEKKRNRMVAFDHRYQMCKLAFLGISTMIVVANDEERCVESLRQRKIEAGTNSSFEISPPGIGTVELLEFLTSSEQGTEFSLALGEDAFRDLVVYHKWKRSKDILTILSDRPWFVFKRPTTDEAIPNEISKQCSNIHWWKFSDPELNGLSSTQVRSMRTLEEWEKVVPPLVMDYVVTNRLYSFRKNDAGMSLVNG